MQIAIGLTLVGRITGGNGGAPVGGGSQYLVHSIGGLTPNYVHETTANASQYLTPGFAYVNEQGA